MAPVYDEIKPFPPPDALRFPELQALAEVWRDRKGELEESGAYQVFLERLHREWAIETGLIERLYTWDRGVTEVLIEQGIEASIITHGAKVSRGEAEHARVLINDHLGVVEGLFEQVKGEQPLTEMFIRQLQAKFTEHQDHTEALGPLGEIVQVPLAKGEYKRLPNNPRRPDGIVHLYCPPERVRDEMPRLVQWYREAEGTHSPEVRAAWLHHRFTQIHPFQDGNGRVARALASLVFLRDGLFPLVIRDSDRVAYIDALEVADAGDLLPLTTLFVRRQKDALLKAISLEREVYEGGQVDEILRSAMEVLKRRERREEGPGAAKVLTVLYRARKLLDHAVSLLAEQASIVDLRLRQAFPEGTAPYSAQSWGATDGTPMSHFRDSDVVEVAKTFRYFPNLARYSALVQLVITTDEAFRYTVNFHGYGPGDTGVIIATAFASVYDPTPLGAEAPRDLRPVCREPFLVNYKEPYDSIEQRFDAWLQESLVLALAEWRRSLSP